MSSEGASLQLQPLSAASLSSAVARLVGGATPAKLMAVRGMAPVRPAELLVAIYQLSFDAEPVVRAAAEAAPASFPDNVIKPAPGRGLAGALAALFCSPPARPTHGRPRENPFQSGHRRRTFLMLAGRLDESLLEIISQNAFQCAFCNAHALPNAQERPGGDGQTGTDDGLDGLDLMVGDGAGFAAKSDDRDDAGYREHLEACFKVETAKHIAREQRQLDCFDAIRPSPPGAITGVDNSPVLWP